MPLLYTGNGSVEKSPSAVVKTLAAVGIWPPRAPFPPVAVGDPTNGPAAAAADMLSLWTWWYSISMGVLGSRPNPEPSTKFMAALGRRLPCAMARVTSAGAYLMVPVV